MRVAAVALVLIVGAVVVLWSGNTLNSWVLGGLIGGFGALLLSIPISLTVFLHLSRRHDAQLKAEAEEERALAEAYEYSENPVEVYEANPDSPDQTWDEDEEASTFRQVPFPPATRLPAPVAFPRLPAAGQSQAYSQRPPFSAPMTQQQARALPPAVREIGNGKAPTQRLGPQHPQDRPQYPGLPSSSQLGSPQSQRRSIALKIAMQEAARGQQGTGSSSTTSRRFPTVRPTQGLTEQPNRSVRPGTRNTSRQLAQQQQQQPSANHYKPQHVVDSAPTQPRRSLPAGEASFNPPAYGYPARGREGERQTEPFSRRSEQTGPMRQTPRTGQIMRNPQLSEQPHNRDIITGSLQNPLQRRAPYMYENDPLRQELAQQLDDSPPVRRSSRHTHEHPRKRYQEEEE